MKYVFASVMTILGIALGSVFFQPAVTWASAFVVGVGGTGTTSVPVNQILTGNGTSAFNSNTATGTSPYGINISAGCFAIGGVCLPSSASAGTMTAIGFGTYGTTTSYMVIATSTSATTGITSALTITQSGQVYTFTPSQSGTRLVTGGGTGAATFTTGILGASGTNAFFTTATSTLGGSGPITVTAGASLFASGAITVACATCNTSSASVTSVGLSSTNSTLSIGSTPITTSGTITADLNLAHSNTWTAIQLFNGNASSTQFSTTIGYFGGTATTTIRGDNATSTFNSSVTIASTTILQQVNASNSFASTTSQGTMLVNWDTGANQRYILNAAATFIINATSSNPLDGGRYLLKICQDGTGSRTATFATPGQLRWIGISPATTTLATAANTCTWLGLIYDASESLYHIASTTGGLTK